MVVSITTFSSSGRSDKVFVTPAAKTRPDNEVNASCSPPDQSPSRSNDGEEFEGDIQRGQSSVSTASLSTVSSSPPEFSPLKTRSRKRQTTAESDAKEDQSSNTRRRRRRLSFQSPGGQACAPSHSTSLTWPREESDGFVSVTLSSDTEYEFKCRREPTGLRFIVLYNEEQIVANSFGLAFKGDRTTKHVILDKFNIIREFRRRGHGTKIMTKLKEWFKKGKTETIQVPAYTSTGAAFYNKFGFLRNDQQTFILPLTSKAKKQYKHLKPRVWDHQLPRGSGRNNSTREGEKVAEGEYGAAAEANGREGDPTPTTNVPSYPSVEHPRQDSLHVKGGVKFVACDEQVGNSCGPHATRNALLCLDNAYASMIDLSLVDVSGNHIDRLLESASAVQFDRDGLLFFAST
jgi:GNAT superfamily N-acetyltransferase